MSRLRAAAALLLLATGCTHLPAYPRSRLADLADVFPMSMAIGWGVSADIKATPLLHMGLGLSPVVSWRIGYEDRAIHGRWKEYQLTFPWPFWLTGVSRVPPRPYGFDDYELGISPLPLVYRWQVRRDADLGEGTLSSSWEPLVRQWGRHPPISRESTGALLIPEDRRELNWHDLRLATSDPEPLATLGSPTRATYWEVSRDGATVPRAWDLFEADVFVGFFGLRLGVRPLEFVDLILGLVTIDISGDDYQAAEVAVPHAPPPKTDAPADVPPAEPPPAEPPPAAEPAPAEPAPADDEPPAEPPKR